MKLLFRIPVRMVLLLLVAGASASLLSLALVQGLESAGIETPRTTLNVLSRWQDRVQTVRSREAVAYLGDSTAFSDKGYKYTIPGRIGKQLAEAEGMPPLVSLADAGLGPVDYYLLASELAQARPPAIVLSVNLASLSPVWMSRSSHPELASLLGLRRWPEAFGLPLSDSGLTADRLFLYPSIHALGLSGTWKALVEYQARVLAGWRALENHLDGSRGPIALRRLAGLGRLSAEREDERLLRAQQWARYGKAIGGLDEMDPNLQVLAATLKNWHRAGIPVLLVVLPVNIDLFEALEIANPEALQRTCDRLMEVARSQGAYGLDLHGLLPSVSFADHYGHFVHGTEPDGARRIADRITPVLESMVGGRL